MAARAIVCLKWGRAYSAEYVNRLYRGALRHLSPPFDFVCFTDDPAGLSPPIDARDIDCLSFGGRVDSVWRKLSLLHPAAGLRGDCLFLDLDVVVLDGLDDFFSLPGEVRIIRNWIEWRKRILRPRPKIGNSSAFRFRAGAHPDVVLRYLENPEGAARDFPTEQAFLTSALGARVDWWPEEWVRSYKRHCRPWFPLNLFVAPRLPARARILAFHGNPKPEQAIAGFCDAKLHRRVLPLSELAAHWR